MNKHDYGVIGLGQFGLEAARTLTELGHNVLALDKDTERVQRAGQILGAVYSGDATDKKVLDQLRFQDLDCVVVSTGHSMETSILVSLNLMDLKVKQLIVKSSSPEHNLVLRRLGVHQVIQPEMEAARRLAHQLDDPGLLDLLSLGGGTMLKQVTVKKWAGRSLAELRLPSDHSVMAVAEKRAASPDFRLVPDPLTPLEEGQQLLLIGQARKIMVLEP